MPRCSPRPALPSRHSCGHSASNTFSTAGRPKFGQEILEATNGEGVDVVLNSLTSEGFIDASLDCLAQGGRFIELARRDILSEAEMAALRPDVKYAILELDVLKKTDPAWVGEVLTEVMERISSGELEPLIHSRWPLAEAGAALGFMRSARHIGKIVLTPPPLIRGQLRQDRAYLVTGGLGGIGLAVAEWLAGHGAGVIVLNGRRDPDPEAEEAIESLRNRGVRIEVELADVTDSRRGRRHDGPHRRKSAAARRLCPQRGRAVGRCPDQPDLGELRSRCCGPRSWAPGNCIAPRSTSTWTCSYFSPAGSA